MNNIQKWEQYFVPQKHRDSGCISWGFEILFRIEGVPNIDYGNFQDRFDFEIDPKTPRRNNFKSVSRVIMDAYPHVSISVIDFSDDNGNEKIEFIETILLNGKPPLISIPLKPFNYPGWHNMPVIEISNDQFYMLNSISSLGAPQILDLSRSKLIETHSSYPDGNDIAFIESIG